MSAPPTPSLLSRLRPYLPVALVATLGLTVTALGVRILLELEGVKREAEFRRLTVERVRAIEHSFDLYVGDLHATLGLFYASETVERDEFVSFVTPIVRDRPALRAVEWVKRVADAERDAFEREARAIYREFAITELAADGKLVRAARRSEYLPVHYLVPYEPNRSALGFDLASEAARRDALARARDTGEPATTGALSVVHAQQEEATVLVFLPRYEPAPATFRAGPASASGGMTRTAADRVTNLEGFVVGVIDVDTLVDEALGYLSPAEVSFVVRDEGGEILGQYGTPMGSAKVAPATALPARLRLSQLLVAGGRQWKVEAAATPAFLAASSSFEPTGAALAGSVTTMLLVVIVFVRERRAELARRLQAQLRESEARYRTLVEYAPEAVFVLDLDAGRFVDANRNALAMFQLDRDAMYASGVADVSAPVQSDGRASAEAFRSYVGPALAGDAPSFTWMIRDAHGRDISCEIRLVQLPSSGRTLIRGSIADLTERAKSEERQRLMLRELDHRVKNNLASVIAIAEQTLTVAGSLGEFRESFIGRIRALASCHEALAAQNWEGVDLSRVAQLMLTPYARDDPRRIKVSGESLMLAPDSAVALSMAIHELATNAAKYGALSSTAGNLDLTWTQDAGVLRITWIERGGPPVAAPDEPGFGMRFLHGVIQYEIDGRVAIEFPTEGLECRIEFPTVSAALSN